MKNPEIRFVKNKNIDRTKWDQCIENSPNGIAYAYTWFLDRICLRKWDALIWGDYLYIMPLVNKCKLGIHYIYQPFFTQQLGIFSPYTTDQEIVNQFLYAIPDKFKLTDMKLNSGNIPTASTFTVNKNTTYHLNLRPSIGDIRENYNTNTRRNIQKAFQNKIFVATLHDTNLFIDFTRKNLKCKSPEVKTKHYLALLEVINYAIINSFGELYGAWDTSHNLIAAAFFLTTRGKCIYLAASSNAKGIEQNAMSMLIDSFINDKAGSRQILDFEGSNISGIARFYAGFGATPQTYYSVHQNRLPSILMLLKKLGV